MHSVVFCCFFEFFSSLMTAVSWRLSFEFIPACTHVYALWSRSLGRLQDHRTPWGAERQTGAQSSFSHISLHLWLNPLLSSSPPLRHLSFQWGKIWFTTTSNHLYLKSSLKRSGEGSNDRKASAIKACSTRHLKQKLEKKGGIHLSEQYCFCLIFFLSV